MTTRIYRYEVPVDGRWHEFDLHGDPLAVGCRDAEAAEFWAYHVEGHPAHRRRFIVVGTGHPLPDVDELHHWGTAVAPGGLLVWHMLEEQS